MKVILFRDLATEEWASMARYADELGAELRHLGCDVHDYVAARPWPGLEGIGGTLANYAWRSIVYPRSAQKHKGELSHIIDHTYAHLVDWLDPGPTVVTCHDLAPIEFKPRGRFLSYRLWRRSFRGMLRATHIITDSSHTRDAILRNSDYPEARITVVPLGVGASFFQPVAGSERRELIQRNGLADRPVILHVGSCHPRKNIETILYALVELEDLAPVFVQIGGQFSRSQHGFIVNAGLTNRIRQYPVVSEQLLRAWYQIALVFAYPSFYEGFGLPVIEAMAAGTPVVCSTSTSLPEVAGNAARHFDPNDPLALSTEIRSIMGSSDLAEELRERGSRRAREFTWENTARLTLDVYERFG